MAPEPGRVPLTERAPGEVICHRGAQGSATVGQFLADAAALAARLPAAGHAIDLCADRYLSLVAFAAAILCGHPMLLGAGKGAAPQFLAMLAERYPGAYAITDGLLPEASLPVVHATAGAAATPVALQPIPLDRVVAIAFTSGSTGAPTAHPKPWGALLAAADAAAERFGLRHPDGPLTQIVATVPPQHMYGFETTMMLPLRANVAIHAGETFFPSEVLEALASVPARRLLVTTPLHLRVLLATGRPSVPLEAVISATAPLAIEMAEAVERDWETRMLEIYGASEAGSVASRRTVLDASWLPYPGVRVLTDAAVVPGLGEVPLGDLLEPLPDGRFHLLGRRADLVKLGGKRASLGELNRALVSLPGVLDGVFVAPEDIESNPSARLTAYVVAPGCSAEAILGALRARIDPAFLPRRVALVAALPRDRLGKLPRQALAGLEAGRA